MSKLSYKTLLIIFLSLLIAVVVLWKFVLPKQSVKAAWWNDSWNYRQAINISSHTSLESNVYIITSVNIGTTTKTQVDDGDFRFIDQSGQNLDYYLASGVGTTNLTFHILIPSFPAGAQTIYAYYGNSSIDNGFSLSDFTTQATNYTIGSLSAEEAGGGPIAYWKFDEGVGTTAYDSIKQQNGTLGQGTLGSPLWTDESQCISGKCLSYDATTSQNVQINKNIGKDWNKNNDFTLSLWFKCNGRGISVGSTQYDYLAGLFSYGNGEGGYGGFYLRQMDTTCSKLQFDAGTSTLQNRIETNITPHLNKWSHYVAVKNNDTLSIYQDGILKNTQTFSGADWFINPNTTSNIGSVHNRSINGLIDEVKIYSYARTAAQIKLDYNSRGSSKGTTANLGVKSNTGPSLSSKLVAYYKLDEGSGILANNSIGNNNNGTLNNSPTWIKGKINNALEFINSGSEPVQPVTIPGNGTLENITDTSYSFSLWVKPSNNTSTQYAFSRPGYHSGLVYTTSQRMQCGIWNSTNNMFSVTSNGIYPINNWYFVTCTIDDANKLIKVYVNGKFDGSVSYSGTLRDYGITNYIIGSGNSSGLCSDSSRFCFNGLIDEVKIYNAALTADEVKQDYNQGSAIQFGSTTQNIGGTTTDLNYCIPGDTSFCASPVAEWKMDEKVGTSIVDTSGNNNTGTFGAGNSAPTWTQGKIGSALSFDGTNDYLNLDSSVNLLKTLTKGTVEFWMNKNSNLRQALFFMGYNTTSYWSILSQNTNQIEFTIWEGNTNVVYGLTNNSFTGWNHITITTDTTGNKIYVNGILQTITYSIGNSSSTNFFNNQSSATSVRIGERNLIGYENFLNGKIDNVKIYNYARTPAQVAYDYNKGGPVGWWKMDECQGNIAYDWSGNNNNGTISIGTSGTQTSVGSCTDNLSTSAWNNGKIGKTNSSLNFDGNDDYININNSNSLNTGDIVTTSIWVKKSINGIRETLVSKFNGGYEIGFESNNKIYIGKSNVNFIAFSTTTITDTNWHHIAWTKNGNINYIYIDGVNVTGTVSNLTLSNNTNSLRIGEQNSSIYFQGQIDDVRIYNYALTSEQVKQIYNGGAVSFN